MPKNVLTWSSHFRLASFALGFLPIMAVLRTDRSASSGAAMYMVTNAL